MYRHARSRPQQAARIRGIGRRPGRVHLAGGQQQARGYLLVAQPVRGEGDAGIQGARAEARASEGRADGADSGEGDEAQARAADPEDGWADDRAGGDAGVAGAAPRVVVIQENERGRPGWGGLFVSASVSDWGGRGGADARVRHGEAMAVRRIDELLAKVARVADDDSRLDPSRLQEAVVSANLIGFDDAGRVLIERSLPHHLAVRDALVA